ncbi:hypothetical protein [Saccharothrix deserti]|uniref:hypothetical protein n=1 Tax=Saccharothrix deserti TaxID=2593674 RepID=UPI00131CAC74|nr:hypothetical protein [Saccharothrix deserti]
MGSYIKASALRLCLFAMAAFLAFGVTTATAQAAPRTPAADDVAVAADCNYVVVAWATGVRSGRGTQYPVVRTKFRGEHMTGPAPCVATSGWFRVYLSTGSYGYVPQADVRYTG